MGLWYEYYLNHNRFKWFGYPFLKVFLSEFIGMSVFVLIGCNRTDFSNSNYMIMNLQLALGYTFGLCMCIGNGGFINPALSIVFWCLGKMNFKELLGNVLAQFFGAICGALLMYSINYVAASETTTWTQTMTSMIKETPQFFGMLLFPGNEETSAVPSMFTVCIKSGLLTMGVMSVIDERSVNPPRYAQPFMVGTVLFAVALTTNHSTYCFLNLAQDLSPRIVLYFLFNKDCWAPYKMSSAVWQIGGPILGALLGALVYIFFIEVHHKNYDSPEETVTDFWDEDANRKEYKTEESIEDLSTKKTE